MGANNGNANSGNFFTQNSHFRSKISKKSINNLFPDNQISYSDSFTANSMEEFEKYMKESQQKMLDMIKQQSEEFYNMIKKSFPSFGAN